MKWGSAHTTPLRGDIRFNRTLTAAVAFAMLILCGASHGQVTFEPPAVLNTNADSDTGTDYRPHLATDGAGNWVAVWHSEDDLAGTVGADRDILTTRSSDNGATWTAPAALNTNASSDSGADDYPRIAADNAGTWIAVWESDENLAGTAGSDNDILVATSTDNGATWSAPAALNTNADSDVGQDYEPIIGTDGAGIWLVVWASTDDLGGTVGSDAEIFVARSTDNGATWTPPAALNSNAGSDAGVDRYPHVTNDQAGNWVCVWQANTNLGGTAGSDEDILVSRSADNGVTWTPVATLNTNADSDWGEDWQACVTTDGAGQWLVAWMTDENPGGAAGTDYDIVFARSADNGATWTPPAALHDNADTDSGYDYRAQPMTDGAGLWVVMWDSNEDLGGTAGTDRDIFVVQSTDNGATWSSPATLNSNADTDSGNDHNARPFTDGAGRWIVAWESAENLGGSIGTDQDLFVAINQVDSLPAASLLALAALGVLLLGLAWRFLRRTALQS